MAVAERLSGSDPLAAAQAMRSAGVGPDLAAAALTQVRLRRRAAAKFGPDAARLWFTPAGLEQATRAVVAERRAARLAAAGITSIADLGCGIGADTIAFARAGLRVLAVEADPTTAAMALSNVETLGLDRVEVRVADATTVELSDVDAIFCDPARRDAARSRRLFDPDSFSPSWSTVVGLSRRVPAAVVKSAPGFDHALIPPGAEAEWVSVDRELVECALWFGPLATVTRRASLLRGGAAFELTGTGEHPAPVGAIRRYVFDPDPAVIRSHLVADFADMVDGTVADPQIGYVFADRPAASPYGRCFEVLEPLPFARKQLRAALRQRCIGRLEILKRGVAVEPDQLRRELRLTGPRSATLLLARFGDRPTALLCTPV